MAHEITRRGLPDNGPVLPTDRGRLKVGATHRHTARHRNDRLGPASQETLIARAVIGASARSARSAGSRSNSKRAMRLLLLAPAPAQLGPRGHSAGAPPMLPCAAPPQLFDRPNKGARIPRDPAKKTLHSSHRLQVVEPRPHRPCLLVGAQSPPSSAPPAQAAPGGRQLQPRRRVDQHPIDISHGAGPALKCLDPAKARDNPSEARLGRPTCQRLGVNPPRGIASPDPGTHGPAPPQRWRHRRRGR